MLWQWLCPLQSWPEVMEAVAAVEAMAEEEAMEGSAAAVELATAFVEGWKETLRLDGADDAAEPLRRR